MGMDNEDAVSALVELLARFELVGPNGPLDIGKRVEMAEQILSEIGPRIALDAVQEMKLTMELQGSLIMEMAPQLKELHRLMVTGSGPQAQRFRNNARPINYVRAERPKGTEFTEDMGG